MPPIIMEEADGEEAELKQLQSNNGKGCHLWALLKSDQAKLKIKELAASKGNVRLRSLRYGTLKSSIFGAIFKHFEWQKIAIHFDNLEFHSNLIFMTHVLITVFF